MYIKLEESEVKKILLVYKSRTGLTKQYAEWIAEEIRNISTQWLLIYRKSFTRVERYICYRFGDQKGEVVTAQTEEKTQIGT